MRNLLRGGPIRQPDFFTVFKRDQNELAALRAKYGKSIEDQSFDPDFTFEGDITDFGDVIDRFLAGQLGPYLIYKPNHNGWSKGVFFLERDAKNRINQVIVSDTSLNGKSYLGSLLERTVSINEVN